MSALAARSLSARSVVGCGWVHRRRIVPTVESSKSTTLWTSQDREMPAILGRRSMRVPHLSSPVSSTSLKRSRLHLGRSGPGLADRLGDLLGLQLRSRLRLRPRDILLRRDPEEEVDGLRGSPGRLMRPKRSTLGDLLRRPSLSSPSCPGFSVLPFPPIHGSRLSSLASPFLPLRPLLRLLDLLRLSRRLNFL
jgi:hypothetical protein